MTLYTQDPEPQEIDGSQLPATFGSVIGAAASMAFDELPLLSSIPKAVELDLARTRYAWTQPKYDASGARSYVESQGLPSDWLEDKAYNKLELDILSRRKREELGRQDVMMRDEGGILSGSARLATALGVGMIDPLNVASAFIPVFSQERYAALLARQSGMLGRAGVRAGVGAVEGTVGAAVIEPLTYAVHEQEMADYSLADSALNIGFGSIFGASLHAGGGALIDLGERARLRQVDRLITETVPAVTPAEPARVAESVSAARPTDDTGPDPFARRPSTERVKESAELQAELREIAKDAGWDTVGGKLIRAPEYEGDPNPAVVGRTPWLPRADWWPGRPGAFNKADTDKIIEKAAAGERLGSKQREYLDYLVEIADARIRNRYFAPTVDELTEVGFAGTRDDSFEVSLVARAKEIDEDAVERFAKQYEDDDDGFLRATKEFVDAHDANANAGRGGIEGLGATPTRAAETVAGLNQTTRDALMRAAIAQTAGDQPIRLDGIMKLETDRAAAPAALRADAEHAARVENSPVADMDAVRVADEQIARVKSDPISQATSEMDEAEALLADSMATIGDIETLPADIRAEIAAADQFSNEVESMNRAASMLVQCALRHSA